MWKVFAPFFQTSEGKLMFKKEKKKKKWATSASQKHCANKPS